MRVSIVCLILAFNSVLFLALIKSAPQSQRANNGFFPASVAVGWLAFVLAYFAIQGNLAGVRARRWLGAGLFGAAFLCYIAAVALGLRFWMPASDFPSELLLAGWLRCRF
jgi:hypothetical protein